MKKSFTHKLIATCLSVIIIFSLCFPVGATVGIESEKTGSNQTENKDIMRGLNLTYTLKSVNGAAGVTHPLESGGAITDITKVEKFTAAYSFKLADSVDESGGAVRSIKEGDYYIIDLPNVMQLTSVTDETYNIMDKVTNKLLATYQFTLNADQTTQIKVTFDKEVQNSSLFNLEGHFSFDFNMDSSGWGDGSENEVIIPIGNGESITIDVTKPNPPETKPKSLTKSVTSYDEAKRKLTWKIVMAPDIGEWEGCTFTDTIDTKYMTFDSLKHGNITLTKDIDYTYDDTTGLITYKIATGRNGADFKEITIVTFVKEDVYATSNSTTIKNIAKLTGGESNVDITSNEASKKIQPNWISKSGKVIDGNRILWTITVNSSKQKMLNAIVTDVLSNDLILDTSTFRVNNNPVTVSTTAHTVLDEDEKAYCTFANNELKYYFPRGIKYATSSKYTITMITDVKKNDTVTTDKTYTNKAKLETQYIGGDGNGYDVTTPNIETDGVGVPNLSVIKSHENLNDDDKRNGTIRWKIQAVSNVSEYGVSRLIDTLPDDQEYIADSIYLGNTKLTENSTPVSAKINEQTLVIEFTGAKAFDKQQTITLKTKMKTEYYGTDNQHTYRNDVVAKIYKDTVMPSLEATALLTKSDYEDVQVQNQIISKGASAYTGGQENPNQRPRVNYSVDINKNRMPLTDVEIIDDLSKLNTRFKNDAGEIKTFEDLKWNFVEGSLSISKLEGSADSIMLDDLIKDFNYNAQANILTIPFGDNVTIEDSYQLVFAVELDLTQNDIFKNNGEIQCINNKATITAGGLYGTISSNTVNGSPVMVNDVLRKSGAYHKNEQQIEWTINLNQHALDVKSTKVVDILPKGLTLDPTSIKLYKDVIKSDGSFITGDAVHDCTPVESGVLNGFYYTYELMNDSTQPEIDGCYKLTVTLPDFKNSYILRFSTDVDSSLYGQTINNSAYYVGDNANNENTDSGMVEVAQSAGGSSSMKGSIEVKKTSNDTDAALGGAVFELNWLPKDKAAVKVRELTTKDDGKVIFRGLALKENYSITEIKAPDGYKLDDPNPKKFTVDENGGVLTPLTFANTPKKAGEWTLKAEKHLSGKDQTNKNFEFVVKDDSTQEVVLNGVTGSKLENNNYAINFTKPDGTNGTFEYEDEHTFSDDENFLVSEKIYAISEISKDMPGYGFDDTTYKLKVKVLNIKGRPNLKIEVYDEQNELISNDYDGFIEHKTPVFNNTYQADGSLQLSAKKILNNHMLAENQFAFELSENGYAIQTVGNNDGVTEQNISIGSIDFALIEYDESDVGNHTYTLKEKTPATLAGGYTYDNSIYTISVSVADNDDNGKLSTTITNISKGKNGTSSIVENNQIDFENTYVTTDVVAEFTANKTLIDRVLENEQFEFKISQVDADGVAITDGVNENVKNNLAGNIKFSSVVYKQNDIDKAFYYQITEINDNKQGYIYDATIYTITDTVRDNNDGTLKIERTIKNNKSENAENIQFSNDYNAVGSTTITATKNLTGKALPNSQFAFTLQEVDVSNFAIGTPQIVRNLANGEIKFETISYTEKNIDKTYYYQIKETNEGIGGYKYDSTIYRVAVHITDNGNGTLNVTQTIDSPLEQEKIIFNNEYTTTNTKVQFNANKTLNGRVLEAEQFVFNLQQVDTAGNAIGEAISAKNTNIGEIVFSEIVYTQNDMGETFYYKLSEVNANAGGYDYDSSVYDISVLVIDQNDGTLTTNTTVTKNGRNVNQAEIIFTNTYTTTDTSANITAKKTLIGKPLLSDQFSYVLSQQENGKNTVLEIAKNHENGDVVFEELKYTQANMGKTYYYTVTEINDSHPGYEFDNTEYTLAISVIDNGNGTLSTEKEITKPAAGGTEETVTEISFSNIYTAIGKTTIKGIKQLEGRKLEAQQFEFELSKLNENGNKIGDVMLCQNNEKGEFYFKDITYTEEDIGKKYTYSITEKNENKLGYQYDESAYTVIVSITDKTDDGKLTVTNSIKKEEQEVKEIKFANKYTATGSIKLQGEKQLMGGELKDNQFSFTLSKENDSAVLQTVKNAANGTFEFDKLNYNQDDIGKHNYTIKEISDNKTGYTYDKSVYIVEVTISDNGDGTLNVLSSFLNSNKKVNEIVFKNEFKKAPTEKNPNTSDNLPVCLLLFITLTSAVAVVLLRRKKIK